MNSEPEQKQRGAPSGQGIEIVSAASSPPLHNPKDSAAASNDPWIGKTLDGRYLILEEIGKGGMGTVYKAQHLTLKHTTVAVKVLSVSQSNDRDKQFRRFDQEAKAASKVKHPHLTTVTDFGLADDESPYLVMDLVKGTSLSAELERHGRFDPVRSMRIFMQICEGMEAAHNCGIIHRDLKPSNIILEKDSNGNDFVRVVDFGIAKLAMEAIEASPKLTQTGEIFGSPLYMSPEQCLGNKLDRRSDIYSLGCLMYETLNGSPPLVGANAVQTIFRHINDAPSQDTLERLRVPSGLVSLVLQALEKQPEDRPQTMEALRKELVEVIAGRNIVRPRVAQKPIAATLPAAGPNGKPLVIFIVVTIALLIAFRIWQDGLGTAQRSPAGQNGQNGLPVGLNRLNAPTVQQGRPPRQLSPAPGQDPGDFYTNYANETANDQDTQRSHTNGSHSP